MTSLIIKIFKGYTFLLRNNKNNYYFYYYINHLYFNININI